MQKLKIQIMRRVYAIWMLRKVFSPFALKVYIAIVLGWQTAVRVHVAMVWNNAPQMTEVQRSVSFFSAAFSQAELSLQLILLFGLALAVWLARDLFATLGRQSVAF